MKFEILTIPPFEKQLKRLVRKYPLLKKEYSLLLDNLEIDPHEGTKLGNNCYKIRLSISSKGKGKAGEARVITNLVIDEKVVYLISIYERV